MLYLDETIVFSSFIMTIGKTAYVGADTDCLVDVLVGTCGKSFQLVFIL